MGVTLLIRFWGKNGRSDRIRTCDPQTPSLMRYQAALRSDRFVLRLFAAAGGDYRRGVRGLQAQVMGQLVWDAKGLSRPPIKKGDPIGSPF